MNTESLEVAISSRPEIVVCGCGKEFEPYRRGATVIKKICPDCLGKKAGHPKKPAKDERPKTQAGQAPDGPGIGEKPQLEAALDQAPGSAPAKITILFKGPDEQLFERIQKLSARQRRTTDAQVLFWLENNVPELTAEEK
jgi:hypothetical protein